MATPTHADAPSRAPLKAGALAGLIAGAVFMMMEMGLVALTGDSPWGPPRMIAAIVMGEGVLPPPASFDLMVMMAAMAVHFLLSIVIGVGFAVVARRLGWIMAVAVGGAVGLALYVVNFYGMTAVFPWFAMARNTISIVSHLVFGLVLGLSFRALAK
ncbi:hypothetical protein GCM10009116_04320 [Brevundimonas basaltis]|uniref:Putative membrane protein YagU involved in acid resistance n=1 Tax=Brevundimonas basaltis TaxID=472166 RepID=A0A7W8HZE7_9CAUL|nr:hypothetical protein [Brevundimonas basaltis]MBB5292701.1 putative membrane protein YagU involved in acid resistance [Brevundimonas basaltis]